MTNPELEDLFERIAQAHGILLDLSAVWADFAEYMDGVIAERFSEQKDPWGNTWEPLSDRWKARKEKEGKHPELILVYENNLNKQINMDFGKDWYEQGTPVEYAAVHQYGDNNRNIPARPFMDITEENLQELKQMLLDYMGWEE